MLVAQKVIDEPGIFSYRFSSGSVGNTGGLYDAFIAAHVIHEPQKSPVQNRKFPVQNLLRRRRRASSHVSPSDCVFFSFLELNLAVP